VTCGAFCEERNAKGEKGDMNTTREVQACQADCLPGIDLVVTTIDGKKQSPKLLPTLENRLKNMIESEIFPCKKDDIWYSERDQMVFHCKYIFEDQLGKIEMRTIARVEYKGNSKWEERLILGRLQISCKDKSRYDKHHERIKKLTKILDGLEIVWNPKRVEVFMDFLVDRLWKYYKRHCLLKYAKSDRAFYIVMVRLGKKDEPKRVSGVNPNPDGGEYQNGRKQPRHVQWYKKPERLGRGEFRYSRRYIKRMEEAFRQLLRNIRLDQIQELIKKSISFRKWDSKKTRELYLCHREAGTGSGLSTMTDREFRRLQRQSSLEIYDTLGRLLKGYIDKGKLKERYSKELPYPTMRLPL